MSTTSSALYFIVYLYPGKGTGYPRSLLEGGRADDAQVVQEFAETDEGLLLEWISVRYPE